MTGEMRRLLNHAGHAKPVLFYPFAAILGVLAAYAWFLFFYAWYLFIVAVIAGMDGPD